jgi:DNA-binding CsgD family transcriptional regulator
MQSLRLPAVAASPSVDFTSFERGLALRAGRPIVPPAPDLHQILCGSGLGILMLDADLCVRYFTPAACALFALDPSDIGRSLAKVSALCADATLFGDAAQVLAGNGGLLPVDLLAKVGPRRRQIGPYRQGSNQISGVVISYSAIPQSLIAGQRLCACCNDLTPRQHDVLQGVMAGQASKTIAHDLGISPRTVESHRSAIMHRLGAKSLPELVQLVLCHA